MNVGVLGTGDVGMALGKGFVERGHRVMLGSRSPQQEGVQEWVRDKGERASAGSLEEAAKFGDVVVLATAWSGAENALRLAKPENLRGKLVIDVTNPLEHTEEGPRLALGHTDSGGEQVQRWLPESRVVKCFNIVNNADMVAPRRPATMFYCGDDEDAKKQVAQILRDFGWRDTVEFGGIDGARYLEPLAMAWVRYGMLHDQWDHAFKLER